MELPVTQCICCGAEWSRPSMRCPVCSAIQIFDGSYHPPYLWGGNGYAVHRDWLSDIQYFQTKTLVV